MQYFPQELCWTHQTNQFWRVDLDPFTLKNCLLSVMLVNHLHVLLSTLIFQHLALPNPRSCTNSVELEYTVRIMKTERPNEMRKPDLKFAKPTHLKVIGSFTISSTFFTHKNCPLGLHGRYALACARNGRLCMILLFSLGEVSFWMCLRTENSQTIIFI